MIDSEAEWCTDHGAAEGRVLRKDAGPLGLGPAASAAVGLGAVGSQHNAPALMAGNTVPSG